MSYSTELIIISVWSGGVSKQEKVIRNNISVCLLYLGRLEVLNFLGKLLPLDNNINCFLLYFYHFFLGA